MIIQGRLNQALEERSFITLEFPDGNYRRVPFFENLHIVENKRANYIKYAPIGRSSPMYSYFGADSRMFDLHFNINTLHIVNTWSKDLFGLTFPANTGVISNITKEDFTKLPSHGGKYKDNKSSSDLFNLEYINLVKSTGGTASSRLERYVLDFVVYWINLVRSTVLNNSSTIIDGPPIVRINHGILYQDVPCICLGYEIDKDDIAGMDNSTLLSRVIKISMSLAEIRHGDFGKYEPTKPIKRDNIIGWESVIKKNYAMTTDPLRVGRAK